MQRATVFERRHSVWSRSTYIDLQEVGEFLFQKKKIKNEMLAVLAQDRRWLELGICTLKNPEPICRMEEMRKRN